MTIRPKIRVHTDLFFLFVHKHSTKVFFHLFFILRATIRPKIKVHTDLFLYMHTDIRSKTRVFINPIQD